MKITVIGNGYVGLVSGVSLALLGHEVVCVGRNESKVRDINSGQTPIYEPGLSELLKKVIHKGRFIASTDLSASVRAADIILIAVGTPTIRNKIDLSSIKTSARQIGEAIAGVKKYQVIVVKSTVVPGTTEQVVLPLIEQYSKRDTRTLGICMNPEFLREGCAVSDATHPDRIVIGQRDKKSGAIYSRVYSSLRVPILRTTLKTAEMTKYAANALFATLISYSNEIARLCENVGGVDAIDVWKGVHLDGRLSPIVNGKKVSPGVLRFIFSGCGYGGSCFPKDTKALLHFAEMSGVETPVIRGVISTNASQPLLLVKRLVKKLGVIRGKKIAVLGLAFKPDTDDIRESPAIPIVTELIRLGASVVCHDPQVYKKNKTHVLELFSVGLMSSVRDALKNADAAIMVTAWQEYKTIQASTFVTLMKRPLVIDGRRLFDAREFMAAGIEYIGVGVADLDAHRNT